MQCYATYGAGMYL